MSAANAPSPWGGNYAATISATGRLGGELAPNTFAENEANDPKAMHWRTLASMPAGRHGTGAAVIGNSIYVAAGSRKPGSGGVTDQLIAFTMP